MWGTAGTLAVCMHEGTQTLLRSKARGPRSRGPPNPRDMGSWRLTLGHLGIRIKLCAQLERLAGIL
jgi:hypothetical protein